MPLVRIQNFLLFLTINPVVKIMCFGIRNIKDNC